MSRSNIFISIFTLLVLSLFLSACDEDPVNGSTINDEGDFMRLELSDSLIWVGSNNAIRLSASMTKDATGETCTFTATKGSFDSNQETTSSTKTVDHDGQATIWWYPPDTAGKVDFISQVSTVTAYADIEVNPVEEINFTNIPDTVEVEEELLLNIQVLQEWAGHAIEIIAPQALLTATGPVEGEITTGTIIKPILDANGELDFLFKAPDLPNTITLKANLYNTIETNRIVVIPTDDE